LARAGAPAVPVPVEAGAASAPLAAGLA
jgi:hypothetical protein